MGMCLTLLVRHRFRSTSLLHENVPFQSLSVCRGRRKAQTFQSIQQEQSSMFHIDINAANLVTQSQTTFLAFKFGLPELGLTTECKIRLWGLRNPICVTVRCCKFRFLGLNSVYPPIRSLRVSVISLSPCNLALVVSPKYKLATGQA